MTAQGNRKGGRGKGPISLPSSPTPGLHPEVREVAERLVATLGEDIRALVWHGSFARGLVADLEDLQ